MSKSTGIIVKLCLVVCPYNRQQPFNSQARDRERKREREEERERGRARERKREREKERERERARERKRELVTITAGAGRRALARDARLSRRTHTFLPPKFQLPQKGSKFVWSSPMRDRQFSAKNHTICHLQNKLSEKEKRLEEVSKENRLLNRLQRRQDKEWSRIQQQEDELPQTLQRHSEEVERNCTTTFSSLTFCPPPPGLLVLPIPPPQDMKR